jgi:ATP-binding cassette subfamily F protein uup
MSILLNLNHLNLSFGEKVLFRSAQLSIQKGDRIGLIGLNGHGKSTLFSIITGDVIPDQSTPKFIYDRSSDQFDVFLVPQELDIERYGDLSVENFYLAFYPELFSLHKKLLEDFSNQGLLEEFERLKGWEIQNAYLNYVKAFKVKDLSAVVSSLSGGERRKLALSVGLSTKAELILWDEPTNHLDIHTIEKFEDELLKSKKTYLIISHDRYLLNHSVDRIVHIDRGSIHTYKGTYLDYLDFLNEKEAELQKNLEKLENRHRRELAWMRQGIKARGTRSKKRVEGFHNIENEIRDFKDRSKKNVKLNLHASGRKSKQMYEVEQGVFKYGDRTLFRDVSFTIKQGDKIALIGDNGAGKSTLVKLINDQLAWDSGKVNPAQSLKTVIFDQNRESLVPTQSLFEFMGQGQDFVHLPDGRRKHVHSYLEQFLFDREQVNRPISTLSGGEKNRLQLAKFMAQSADLWIFDEPTNDLDIETIEILERELKNYNSTLIIIGHDRAFLDHVCERTWVIFEQQIEQFPGGFTQVAPFLEAVQAKVENQGAEESLAKPQKEKVKLSNKEKQRVKLIDGEIESVEGEISLLDEQLSGFDFSSMSKDKQDEFEQINRKKESLSLVLEKLYIEWEQLQEKLENQ